MNYLSRLTVLATVVLLPALLFPGHDGEISFSKRLDAMRAIEEVYMRHRIGTDISGERRVSKEVLIRKVNDCLYKSAALEIYAGEVITPYDLQEEMERMARDTKMPERLEELFAALDHDPLLIAECLARPILTERRFRDWFVFNRELHKDVRNRAESTRKNLTFERFGTQSEGILHSLVFRVHPEEENPSDSAPDNPYTIDVTAETLKEYNLTFPPVGTVGEVEETIHDFRIIRTLRMESDSLSVQYLLFPKRSYSEWWEEVRNENLTSTFFVNTDYKYILPLASRSGRSCGWIPQVPNPVPTTVGAPSARYVPSVVWTGSEMIIWGGNASSITNTGGCYDPATDSWSDTSTVNAPTARTQHTAVWTGTEMIIWGGISNTSQLLKTGKRYDPVSNTWADIDTPGWSVSSRRRHTAVWTGTLMIVWGGYGSSGYMNKGGRYNLGTDSWESTEYDTAPSARCDHTAVWTGTEMIIWGGTNGSYLNTGGKYDPVNNTWVATATTNAPVGRYKHTAVWTGSKMIVWGGSVSGDPWYTNTGGIYTLGSRKPDSWSDTSLTGAPAGRDSFSGVWTGSQLIVWGGWISGGPTQTGGIYTLSDNSWVDTPLIDAPQASYSHRGVWADDKMIVWGGIDSGGANLNRGGIYDCGASVIDPPSLLRVVKDPASSTGYYFYVAKVTGATGYNVYEGTQGIWYDHGSGSHCAVVWEDMGTEVRGEVTLQSTDSYYLVTAHDGVTESASGFASSGDERDPAQNTCAP